MNYDQWKKGERSAVSLFLDPQNPRIPPAAKPFTEPELIEELALHDDVYELSKKIAANGFFPSEPLVAVKENDKLLVVEGNRRLAACKLLLNPRLAPESLKSRFENLSATFDHNLLKKVPILIAPSREATIPLIIARHTASQIATWKPAMQAHFYHTLVQRGLSLEEVAEKFHLTPGEIKDELVSHNLYTMACRLDLPTATAEIVRDPRKFKLTTLTRIFETPAGREFFGVKFEDDGTIVGTIDQNEFTKGFSKVVSDVALGEADSRKLNSPEEIKAHLDKYNPSEMPDLKKKGHFDSTTFMVTTARQRRQSHKKQKPTPTKTSTPKGLFPRNLICNIQNQRVQDLFTELRRLYPSSFPNSCTCAFRCFLELSVSCFLDAKGEIAKMKAEELAAINKYNANVPSGKPQKTLPAHWTPELSDMLKWIADPKRNVLSQGHITRALSQAIHDERDLISLNLVSHNPAYPATESRLRESYARLEEFLKIILA